MRKINYSMLPEHMREPTRLYIEEGVQGGDFLTHVMMNKFVQSFKAADSINREALTKWARFLYSEAPAACWGSMYKVQEWIQMGGLKGIQEKIAELEGRHEKE